MFDRNLLASATTPFGTFNGCLQTREFSALESDITELKFYAPGIGFIQSQAMGGEAEVLRLVSFIP